MNIKDYQAFCKTTEFHQKDKEKDLMILGLGISGEAGDVAGCIKKTCGHKDDQTAGIRENLGDTMWYIASICNYYGWNLGDVLKENKVKLNKRFEKGVTLKAAARNGKRIDWNEKH